MRKKDELKALGIRSSVIKLARDFGLQGISMSKIAKDCGISSSTIYTYYKDKNEMIHSIYHDLREKRHNNIYNSIKEGMNAEETLKVIYLDFYDYLIEFEDEYYYIRQFSSCPCLDEEIREKEYHIAIDKIIGGFIESGDLVDVDITIIHAMLSSTIERIAENYFTGKRKLSRDEIIKSFDLIWKGIKAH
ncbi:TetR/AcrR family transcriptional regulator [Acidaminobacter sp. JC074]|uniref:TetR/AcrR family transcriptional regulator n=1 Tax=Acidaminobacter sp. JC074 TaxID=2530199 RepID=UPI001F108217|nr:TetR/AcrR family transcriptional regulator [Acidaminobacter sp. JC074]MCH4890185.1 TetR/AcrR family transcriptional regulator [Acidaminobacter sp. JC074]